MEMAEPPPSMVFCSYEKLKSTPGMSLSSRRSTSLSSCCERSRSLTGTSRMSIFPEWSVVSPNAAANPSP